MLVLFAVGTVGAVSWTACSKEKPLSERLAESARIEPPAAAPPARSSQIALAASSASPKLPARPAGPPRPLPRGEWGPIQVTAPIDVQQKALAYLYAMASPGPDDPPVNQDFLNDALKKIDVAARTADRGDKRFTHVSAAQGNRKVAIELGAGCNEKTPSNVVVQRAGITLLSLQQAGVLAIECHDAKWKCIQSTREQDDVLCVVAPRR